MDLYRAIGPRVHVSLRFLLLLGCAGTVATAHQAIAAGALPTGGHFVAGTGGIASSGATTTITQSSKRGIIDWKSFSIGKAGTVQFDNGTGATLNKVTGGSLSTIAGQLKATGSVYLINPNGVVVAAGGKVVTGGSFVASTRDTSDSQFMAGGNQYFTGTSNGAVVNDGAVVSQSGSVVLIGHAVTNSGTIDAAKGTAALASGNRVLMTDASGPDRVYVAGRSGDTTNDGQVRAAAVELAAAGGNVYALAGNRDGLIRATGTKTVNGQVWLTAPDGAVDVAGKVVATDADGSGGKIYAKGASLTIADKTVLNAAGKTGHGRINTSGGKVSIGKATVTAGQKGRWVVDPADLTINASAATTIGSTLNGGTDVIQQTTAAGSGGNGDIIVAAPISWNTTAQLTLSSFHDIDIDAAITATGNGAVALTTNNNLGGTSSGAGTLNFLMGQGSLQIAGGTGALTIDGAAYTLVHTVAELQAVGSSGNYALAANIDATSSGTLSGSPVALFAGTFNGLGNTVSNLTIVTAAANAGLFGRLDAGGLVTNIGVIGGSVTSSSADPSASVGGLVGYNALGSITNSFATDSVTAAAAAYVGGLAGQSQGPISQCYATGAVTGGTLTGGLLGFNRSTVSNSYATGVVSSAAGTDTGGLVGLNFVGSSAAVITDSYSTGKVTGGGAVGGLAGGNIGTVTDSYWDTDTSAVATSAGGTGLTTAQLSAGLPTGFSSSIWANLGNKTTPYLGGNPGPVYVGSDTFLSNLIFTVPQLLAVDSNPSGKYALAASLDLSGTTYTGAPIGETTAFTGTFNGLGNTIDDLSINTGASGAVFAGLFGQIGVGGTVKNIGLTGVSISAGGNLATLDLGGLAGVNAGTITSAYVTGTVAGTSASAAGGLVGLNTGTITDTYATGFASAAGAGLSGNAGGLAGINTGLIADAYAISGVTVSAGNAGGLVGSNSGAIQETYAAGVIAPGAASKGGLVSFNSGTITDSYWNMDRVGSSVAGVASGPGTVTSVNGLSGSQPFITASYTGFTFSTTPGTADAWVMVDKDGTLNGANGAAMPMLAFEYSTNIVNAHQLQLMAMDSTANYTLVRNIDATATGSSVSVSTGTDVWGASGFGVLNALSPYTGTVDGNGHTISGLTIRSSGNAEVGLFGQVDGGTVRNVNLSSGSVFGDASAIAVGGLVGQNQGGTITNVSNSGSVVSLGILAVGGLVGTNDGGGTIANASATGTVTAANASDVGGLVGRSVTLFGGGESITNSTATGAVSGLNNVGGLVGDNNATLSGSSATGAVIGASDVGGLVGVNDTTGSIANSHANGAVTGTIATAVVGGLAGENNGSIGNSFATGTVTATIGGTGVPASGATAGGLVGTSTGAITLSTSSGAVTVGTDSNGVGGLIGLSSGTVDQSSSISTVTAGNDGQNIGGLIGEASGAITNSFSTGAVSVIASNFVGGLVGQNFGGGTITQSFSTSSVTGTGFSNSVGGLVGEAGAAISQSFSGGPVSGAVSIGGLVGDLVNTSVTQSYSVGSATGTGGSVGGLVGSSHGGSYSETFATGVSAGPAAVGGLIGQSVLDTSLNSYWDIGTTGHVNGTGTGVVTGSLAGKTTAQLQAALPTGFSSSVWGIVAGKSYAYLKFQFGVGATPQVIAGTVYTNGGTANAGAGITVNAMANGGNINSTLTGGTVTTGANGYYYYLVTPGTIGPNANVLTYARNYGSGSAISGVAATDQSNGYPLHLDILGNTLHVETQSGSWNTAGSNITTASGGVPLVTGLIAGLSNLRVDAFNTSGFAIDTAMTTPGNVIVEAAGDLSIAGGSVTAGGSATLATAGNFSNSAGAGAISAGSRWLVYSANPNNDTDGGLADNFIQYGATHPTNATLAATLHYGAGTAALGTGNGFLYSAAATVNVTGVSKTYDGSTSLTSSPTSFTTTGAIAGDTVTLGGSLAGSSFASANAGTNIDVTLSNLTITATRGGVTVFGYTLASLPPGNTIGTITPANLTINLTGTVTKTYDGNTVATLGSGNFSLSGLVAGDHVAVASGAATYASGNVGSGILVTASGYSLSGVDAGNYVLTATSGSGTIGKITPKTLTVSLTGTVDKTYDGSTAAALAGGNYTLGGVIGGDAVTLNGPTAGIYNNANAGSGKLVTVTGLGLTGVDAGNYRIVGSVSGAVGKIDPKALTVSLTGTVDKTYDGTTGATLTGGNYVLGGVVGGDAVTLNDPAAGTYDTANAGNGKLVTVTGLSLVGPDAGNYSVSVSAAGIIGTIDRATLTVTANDVTRTYDRTAFSGGNGVTYGGFVNGETSAVLGGTLGYAGTSQGAVDAGRYGIKAKGLTSGNYTLVYDAGTLTIDPKVVTAGLTGTVTKTYDGTTAATLTSGNYLLSGVIAGDTVTLNDPTKGTYGAAQSGNGIAVTVGGLALLGAEAGDYRLASMTVTGNIGTITGGAVSPVVPPFIPVIPPQPSPPAADAQSAADAAHSLVVPRPELSDMAKLSGCSGEDFVAVVPEENGHVGAVVVESDGNKTLLHAAYAGCAGSKPVMTNAQEVNNLFGVALAARPTPPASYDLYYDTGSVTLVPNALAAFDKVFAEIMKRKAAEVVVAGYTDTVGNPAVNDRLSLERAQTVSKLLVARGLAAVSVTAVGRGERDPQVPTAAQIAEQKNRRVEITVR